MSRRLMRVLVDGDLLGTVLTQGYVPPLAQIVEGLPPGAKYQYCYTDGTTVCVALVFEHESFDEVPPGDIIPDHPVSVAMHGNWCIGPASVDMIVSEAHIVEVKRP